MVQSYRTFGVIFAGSVSLFRLVPYICQLATDRRIELSEGQNLGCRLKFEGLRDIIQGWSLSTDFDTTTSLIAVTADNQGENFMAGQVVRNTLLMFLMSSYHHDVYYLREALYPLVEETIDMMTVAEALVRTPWTNLLFWPMCVIGTYTTTTSQRQRFLSFISKDIPLCHRMKKVLRWMWEADDSVYGLQGFSDMLKLHKVDFAWG